MHEAGALHGGNVHQIIREQGATWQSILDFSANINPLGLSPQITTSITEALDTIIHYPDPEAIALKQAISRCYNVPEETIIPGNGAVELLYLLCHTLRPGKVTVPAPTFSEYERAARAAGALIQYSYLCPEDQFAVNVQTLAASGQGGIIFLGNPNNPTGTVISRDRIECLVKECCNQGTLVVVDESFIDFLSDDAALTCRPLLQKYDNIVVLHSLTKFYAIPGLRLGFALANPDLAKTLHNSKDPWNVNTFAQAAGVTALADAAYRAASKKLIVQAKDDMYQALLRVPGFQPYPPAANFILINVSATQKTSAWWRQALSRHGILIRDCSNYPGLSCDYIRVAVKLPEQNAVLLHRLQHIGR